MGFEANNAVVSQAVQNHTALLLSCREYSITDNSDMSTFYEVSCHVDCRTTLFFLACQTGYDLLRAMKLGLDGALLLHLR